MHTISGQCAWTQLLLFFQNYSSILWCSWAAAAILLSLCPHEIVYIQLLTYVTCVGEREGSCLRACVCLCVGVHSKTPHDDVDGDDVPSRCRRQRWWTNRKYVHLIFSSMNFRSNNWMIRDLETKCTKTWTQSDTVWCTTYLVFSQHRASCACVCVCGWFGLSTGLHASETNAQCIQFTVDYVFIFPLQLATPYTAPKLLCRIRSSVGALIRFCESIEMCRSLESREADCVMDAGCKSFWWLVLSFAFDQKWHWLASTIGMMLGACKRCVLRACHPAAAAAALDFGTTHSRISFIIRSKLLSNSLSLLLWSAAIMFFDWRPAARSLSPKSEWQMHAEMERAMQILICHLKYNFNCNINNNL